MTSLTSALSQGVAIAAALVSVPLTVGYLGQERYGIWLTLSSLLSWLAIADLGLGGGAIVNALSDANGRDDRALAQELVATGFWTLAGISLVLAALFAAAFPFVSWAAVFNVSAAVPPGELRSAVVLAFAAFVLTFPTSVFGAAYHGYQEGYVGNLWVAAGSALSLAALLVVTRFEGGLPQLVLALWGARFVVGLGSAVYLFGRLRPWLLPRPGAATRRAFGRLMALGLQYLVAQLAGLGMFQSQPILVTHLVGPSAVAVFAVAQRLLTLPLVAVQIATFPLMPAYGEARVREDWTWIRRTLQRSLRYAALAAPCLILPLALAAPAVVRRWVGPQMVPSGAVIGGLAVYCVVCALLTPVSVMLYGLEQIRGQARIALLNAVLTVSAGVAFTRLWGLPGMAAAMVLGMLAGNAVGQWLEATRALKSAPPAA